MYKIDGVNAVSGARGRFPAPPLEATKKNPENSKSWIFRRERRRAASSLSPRMGAEALPLRWGAAVLAEALPEAGAVFSAASTSLEDVGIPTAEGRICWNLNTQDGEVNLVFF